MLIVRAFPVRSRAAIDEFARQMYERTDDARRFYESFGIAREAWFFQRWDHGAIVIGFTDADEPALAQVDEYAATREEFAAWFKDQVKAATGIDPNVEPLGPQSDQVFDSAGSGPLERNIPLVVRAYPLKSREALEDFIDDVHKRPDETRAMYQRLGVRELWFVQETGHGPIKIAVAAAEDPDSAAREYGRSTDRFSIWFKQRVQDVSGVNPHLTPFGPETEKVFDFVR